MSKVFEAAEIKDHATGTYSIDDRSKNDQAWAVGLRTLTAQIVKQPFSLLEDKD